MDYDDLTAEQRACIEWISNGEDALVCADIGTGKTVIAETVIDRIPRSRWLVLAPLLVADEVWRTEHLQWVHLSHLKVALATGAEKQRIAAVESDADIVVMNYENITWLMEQYPRPKKGQPDSLPFDGLICDELDKLKSVSSNRFKAFRERVKHFKMRIGLTGTPTPNHLTELWGQVYVIDGGETFGRSFYKWRSEYFFPTDFKQYNWEPFPNTEKTLFEKLEGLTYRLKAVGLPEVVINKPAQLELPESVREKYQELHTELILVLDDSRVVDAANQAVLGGKLQQMCAGFSYVAPEDCPACRGPIIIAEPPRAYCSKCHKHLKPDAVWHSHEKFHWLDKLLVDHQNKQVLVFYHFVEELEELQRWYPDMLSLGSKVSKTKKRAAIEAWNAGDLPYLALHPASAGHGLNLQKSGAHHIALLTLPWSGGAFQQLVGRLARRGQAAEKIYVHSAVFKDTIDEKVHATVISKVEALEKFLSGLYQG